MHNIEYFNYQENVDKNKVTTEIDEYISDNGEYGGNGVRWCRDKICSNIEEAKKWIEDHDQGWYDQLAIRYYKSIPSKTAKLKELEEKVNETYKDYYKKDHVSYPKTRTSEFIGCAKCKSRMKTEYLFSNSCPICRADLRPDTMLKTIAAAKNRWEKAKLTLANYTNKTGTKEVRWLVKIEYHT